MDKTLQLTAVIEREGDAYVATCIDLDVVSQGSTAEQARLNLVEAVELFFETAAPSEVRRRLKHPKIVTSIMPTMPAIHTKQSNTRKAAAKV